jgi:PiT family inorganic phosphate transporter
VFTWWYGIPSSSSHALIGGIMGAVIAKAGLGKLVWAGIGKTVPSSSSRRCWATCWAR